MDNNYFHIIVVGAGHAGCEAALAACRLGMKVLLITQNLDHIAFMSCNPAIGGLAKGHLVKEIDAFGGEMARNIDATGIQFRCLNTRKGPAVRATRAQADRALYAHRMKKVLESASNLHLKQGTVENLLLSSGKVTGVRTTQGIQYRAEAVVLTTGTFLNGLIHIGLSSYPAGRAGDPPSIGLSESLAGIGFRIGRLKTGTTPRLDGKSIDFSRLTVQKGDPNPTPFSFSTEKIDVERQIPCHITHTNPRTHEIIRSSLDRSPLYQGVIQGIGPRYCPSIEDKVVRFPDRERHQIFLEPEGIDTMEYYPNGISTSLPIDVQIEMVRSIEGLEQAEIMRSGYAIEYDFADPTQLSATLEAKLVENLYHAGQINGTSGYEEAAAQGLIAGANAALRLLGREPLLVDRCEGYIGVLIDDLITKGTDEPYRMFTSRAEYRLLLREDNADLRLFDKAFTAGLISKELYDKRARKKEMIEKEIDRLTRSKLTPDPGTLDRLHHIGTNPIRTPTTAKELLRRPELDLPALEGICPRGFDLPAEVIEQVEIQIKYEGYLERQQEMATKFKSSEHIRIPEDLDYHRLFGLSTEVKEKLSAIRPFSIGQASRIPGITPAAISVLLIHLKRSGHI